MVETTGNLFERLLPKSIHAVTARGFELKVALFVLVASINFLWQQLGSLCEFLARIHAKLKQNAPLPKAFQP